MLPAGAVPFLVPPGYGVWARASAPCVREAGAVYRARRPEESCLYRLLEQHFEEYLRCHEERFEPADGPLAPHVSRVVLEFLECGRLHGGFARIRCGDCKAERLLAFSCQTRNLCPSCQSKRAALLGSKLADEILAPVPHTHLVFTIPRVLRGLFQRDRRLLGILSRAAHAALLEWMQAELGRRDVVPGFVGGVQTFGGYAANWHPHVHGIATEGAFTRDGDFHSVWNLDTDAIEERFREHVLRELVQAERLSEDFAARLRTWQPSGFDVHAGRQMTRGENRRMEEMGRYIARPPLAQDRPEILPDGRVLVPTPPQPQTGATELILDPLELVHRIVLQIPDRRSHMIRYYGAYSCRGRRARAEPRESGGENEGATEREDAQPGHSTDGAEHPEDTRSARRSWARLIRRIFEVDPLECESCGGTMRVISVITDPEVVTHILQHLAKKQAKPPARAPPPG
jgi:hypothetical protein